MKARLAVDVLNCAVTRHDDFTGCVAHPDRGNQFRIREFAHALRCPGLVGSMGRVGAAGDHVAMESFFSLFKKNSLDRAIMGHSENAQLRNRDFDQADLSAQALLRSTRPFDVDRSSSVMLNP